MKTVGLRQTMSDVHSWSGLLLGWLLFMMFCCGTVSFFQEEVTRWMQPEAVPARSQADAVSTAQSWLEKNAPGSTTWYITPPGTRAAVTQVFWIPAEGRQPRGETSAKIDGTGQEVRARETAGGFFLYRFHFDLHYMPVIWARYLVGVAAMFMLIAILSGIITHKKIFTDFFMLRFGKGQRSWLDAHNVTAVLALPFHLMITYTGLVSLASMYAPAPIAAAFASEDSYFAASFPQGAAAEPSDVRAPLAPLGRIVTDAARRLGGSEVGYIVVSHPGDRAATIAVTSSPAAFDTRGRTIRYSGVTGRPLADGPARGGAQQTESVMIGVHAGRYADSVLRWLYFVAGLFGTAMVGTGLVLWTAKRRLRLPDPTRPHIGFRIVERLNIGVVCGFPLGLAAYFLANRLLPAGLEARPDAEINVMFGAFGAALLWSVLRPPFRGWRELSAAASAAFLAVPIVSAITIAPSPVVAWRSGSPLFVAVDLLMLLAAAAFATISLRVRPTLAKPAKRARAS